MKTELAAGLSLGALLALASCGSPGENELVQVTPDWPGLELESWSIPKTLAPGFDEGVERAGSMEVFAAGDRLLFALEVRDGEARERWFLELEVTSAFAVDVIEGAADGVCSVPEVSATSTISWGDQDHEIVLTSNLYQAAIRLFDDRGVSLGESSVRVPHHISAGVLDVTASMARLEESAERIKRGEEVEFDPKTDLLTPFARALSTIGAVFQIVDEDELLRPILMRAASLPSLWSVVMNGGVRLRWSVDFMQTALVEVPPAYLPSRDECRAVPMQLTANDEVVLDLEILAMDPAAPLLPCGGFVGIVGHSPKRADLQVEVALIGARCAPAKDGSR